MQGTVTTTGGKIKIKVVLLGNQMVGKSSLI
jgi:GTPase SAR1 family protein